MSKELFSVHVKEVYISDAELGLSVTVSGLRVFMQLQNHFEYWILHPSPGDAIYSNDNFE